MWFTGINYYKMAVAKDRDSIFTNITTRNGRKNRGFTTNWKPGLKFSDNICLQRSPTTQSMTVPKFQVM